MMDNATLTALATALLVIVGLAQMGVLVAQKRQASLEFIEIYRKRWSDSQREWGATIFLGRDATEYYQAADKATLEQLTQAVSQATLSEPTIWARDSVRTIFSTLSDVCLKILQGQLGVSDIYPVFGSELLRHSRPLRVLLDTSFSSPRSYGSDERHHSQIRREVQDWLIYHDGIRRRCLILIDLLWAEAARLEDLPPSDLKSAADAKRRSGSVNRLRLKRECMRLNGVNGIFRVQVLSYFLRNAEYKGRLRRIGIDPKRLEELDKEWTKRLLHNWNRNG